MLFLKVAVFYSRRQTAVCFLNKFFFFIPKEWFRLVASLNTCLQFPGVLDTLENISGAEELSITWIEESSQFFL